MFQAEKDDDKNVFQDMKMYVDAEYNEFEEVNSYFVDSSGFGKKSDPALTMNEFLKKVKVGRFYAITGIGQFQVRISEYVKIEKEKT